MRAWSTTRAHFDLAERAARFGYWRVELADGSTYWSPGMYRLLGLDPDRKPPDSDWLLEQMMPEDKAVVAGRDRHRDQDALAVLLSHACARSRMSRRRSSTRRAKSPSATTAASYR